MRHLFHKRTFTKKHKFILVSFLTIIITILIFAGFGYVLYIRSKPMTQTNKPLQLIHTKDQASSNGSDIAIWIAIFVAISAGSYGANSVKNKKKR